MRVTRLLGHLTAFAGRHRWSLPLAGLAALCFGRVAREIREREAGPFDATLSAAVTQLRGRIDEPMLWLTRFGNGASLTLLTLGAGCALLAVKRRREFVFIATVGISIRLLEVALKLYFHRNRPGASALYILAEPGSFSFPSGHALGSTGVLFGLLIVVRVCGVRGAHFVLLAGASFALAAGVAASRVYFGVHFPTDVVGGMLAGAGWVSALTGFFYPATLRGEAAKLAEEIEPRE